MVNIKKQTIINKDISCNESITTTAHKLLVNNVAILEQTVNNLNEEVIATSEIF